MPLSYGSYRPTVLASFLNAAVLHDSYYVSLALGAIRMLMFARTMHCTVLHDQTPVAWFPGRLKMLLTGLLWLGLVATLCGCNLSNGWLMSSSGRALYRRGNYTAARYEFERALMDRPYNANDAYNVAKAMEQQGNLQEAEQMYQHALNLRPSHAPAYQGLAALLVSQGRQGEAQQLMQGWVDTQPYLPQSRTGLATVQRKTGDYASAEQNLQQALQMQPRQPKALSELAQVYQATGRPNEARGYFRRSLLLNPAQPEVRSQMLAAQPRAYPSGALQMAQAMSLNDPALAGGAIFANGYGPPSANIMPAGGTMYDTPYSTTTPAIMGPTLPSTSSQMMPLGPGDPYSSFPNSGTPYPAGTTYAVPGAIMQTMPPTSYVPGPQPGVYQSTPQSLAPPLPSVEYSTPSPYSTQPQLQPQPQAYGPPVQLGPPVPMTGLVPGTAWPISQNPAASSPQAPVMLGSVPATPAF